MKASDTDFLHISSPYFLFSAECLNAPCFISVYSKEYCPWIGEEKNPYIREGHSSCTEECLVDKESDLLLLWP